MSMLGANKSKVTPVDQRSPLRLRASSEIGLTQLSYNQKKLANEKSAKKMLKMMSFEVPLDDLYTIKSACVQSELNYFCPIVLEITNPQL